LIRRYRGFLALIKNKCKSAELYNEAINEMKIQEIECPYCKNMGQCKKHGKYTRYILEWVKGKKVCSSLEVIRVRCQYCDRTHSILPSFIIPYSSYGLCFVLGVVQCYYKGDITVSEICEKYDISESMLYRWKHIFEKCHEGWLRLLRGLIARNGNIIEQDVIEQVGYALDFISFIKLSDSFLNNYQLLFHRSFMERFG